MFEHAGLLLQIAYKICLLCTWVYLGVRTFEKCLCFGVIVFLLYIVLRFFVVLIVFGFTSLVSFRDHRE